VTNETKARNRQWNSTGDRRWSSPTYDPHTSGTFAWEIIRRSIIRVWILRTWNQHGTVLRRWAAGALAMWLRLGWGMNWFGGGLSLTAALQSLRLRYARVRRDMARLRRPRNRRRDDRLGSRSQPRQGVGYGNSQLNNRYGAASQASRMAATSRSAAWGLQRFSRPGVELVPGARRKPARGLPVRQAGRRSSYGRSQMNTQRNQAPVSGIPRRRTQLLAPSYARGRSYSGGVACARSFGGGGGGSRSFGGRRGRSAVVRWRSCLLGRHL